MDRYPYVRTMALLILEHANSLSPRERESCEALIASSESWEQHYGVLLGGGGTLPQPYGGLLDTRARGLGVPHDTCEMVWEMFGGNKK